VQDAGLRTGVAGVAQVKDRLQVPRRVLPEDFTEAELQRNSMVSLLNAAADIAARYFALWVVLACVLGILSPQSFAWAGPNIALLLGVVMFGVGAMLKPSDLAAILRRPWAAIGGVAAQYIIMGPLALLLSMLFDLPADLTVGMILVGTAPGGTSSNVVTLLARGDVALSVSITSESTLLAPLLTPLLTLSLIGSAVDIDTLGLFLSILEIVIVPVALGITLNGLFGQRIDPIRPVLPLISVLVIMVIVAFVIGANWRQFHAISVSLMAAVALHNLLGLGLGYAAAWLAGLPSASRRALCFEVGMQNSGLATTLATLHFNPIAALPGALFSVWHSLSGPLLATYWRSRPANPDS
jgi:bile acid:Na+ symporter, BASS family